MKMERDATKFCQIGATVISDRRSGGFERKSRYLIGIYVLPNFSFYEGVIIFDEGGYY
jgi:hypothetical protein